MRTLNLAVERGLEFLDLPHRRLGHASLSINFGHLEVGMEFDSKDAFIVVVKWYNIQFGINFNVTCSRSQKYEANCVNARSRITMENHGICKEEVIILDD